ncbi:MAG: replication-relaxation family protein [Anaerolineales bacterium]
MTARNQELIEYLRRNPYCNESFLCRLYGREVFQMMLADDDAGIKVIEVKQSGKCFADKKEPSSSLVDLRRLEMARDFILYSLGREAAFTAISPGIDSDCEFFWKDLWWRLWVDPGGCAPEALGMFVSPPKQFGNEIRDLILTPFQDRLDPISHQVERNWRSHQDVYVMIAEGDSYRIVRLKHRLKKDRCEPISKKDIQAHIKVRQRGGRKRSLMGEIAKELDLTDWSLLVDLGNVPLLKTYELAYLRSDDARTVKLIIQRLQAIEELGLIETAKSPVARDQLKKRKMLTSLGLELLAAHWKTTTAYMRLMQPWPQGIDAKEGRPHYSLGWLSKFGNHYRYVRRMALALVYGARCVSSPILSVDAKVITTIGTRLIYREYQIGGSNSKAGIVVPDGLMKVSISQKGWVDGQHTSVSRPVQENTIWLEVDMGGTGLKRLEAKMNGYAHIWRNLEKLKPVLVWLIKGSPYRESQILKLMKERNIEGYTVLHNRLHLPEDDAWWSVHTPASLSSSIKVGINYEAVGGMAPWRNVWGTTDHSELAPFLGLPLDGKRDFYRSPERESDREWVVYKVV